MRASRKSDPKYFGQATATAGCAGHMTCSQTGIFIYRKKFAAGTNSRPNYGFDNATTTSANEI